jgi:hypothetical protein
MEAATLSPKRPASAGAPINLRLILLLAIVAAPFLYFGFVMIRDAVTGGVIRHGDYTEVDLKSMGNFHFDENRDGVEAVPQRFRDLDGKRVLLEGEMFAPNEAANDVRRFELVYNIQKCCFGGPPKVQERVFAKVPDQTQGIPNYQFRSPVRVTGKLHVKAIKGVDGTVAALYMLDVENVEPV